MNLPCNEWETNGKQRDRINIYYHNYFPIILGNMGTLVSGENIKKWKIDGWNFRKKTVKGYHYITRRKGKQEKSLGKYNEGLWKLIERTTIEPSLNEKRDKAKKTIVQILDLLRPIIMSTSCSHIVDELCFFWKYYERPGFFNIADAQLGEGYYRKISNKNEKEFWVFKARSFYCRNCSAYIRSTK
jgi:hypothetical protein